MKHLEDFSTCMQKDHDELKVQFYKDRGALEAKYEKLYQPLYDKVALYN